MGNFYGTLVNPLGHIGFTAVTTRATRPFLQVIERFVLVGIFAFDGLLGGAMLTLS